MKIRGWRIVTDDGRVFVRAGWRAHWSYLRYVLRHKLFVYRHGRRFGVGRWQLLKHDWSKFTRSEWGPYVRWFYIDHGSEAEFDRAWLHHQKWNKHHWQWWVLPEDDGGTKVLPMPDRYRREMLADWFGAGEALGFPDTPGWYEENGHKMLLHPDTRVWVEARLAEERERLAA